MQYKFQAAGIRFEGDWGVSYKGEAFWRRHDSDQCQTEAPPKRG